ncbi:glyoxalase [Pedobacter cryoconitis]|uniref:Glyoxalase n=1 Tax=Pedobacter cryoconitis TaxID=188932 RepID=A0A127V799_9SPHI|nr:VOC family protein [Pedobacter cryoconitis]AMP97154.1 glyoxalase [Pedobacter cryoconitis]
MAMFKDVKAFSGFSVKEISEAMKFYGEILGLEISQTMGQLVLHIASGGTVFVYAKPNHVPATFTVLNFPVQNLQEAMNELHKKGVEFIIYKEKDFETDDQGVFHGGGPKIAWFKDPSGNILSVLERDSTE